MSTPIEANAGELVSNFVERLLPMARAEGFIDAVFNDTVFRIYGIDSVMHGVERWHYERTIQQLRLGVAQ